MPSNTLAFTSLPPDPALTSFTQAGIIAINTDLMVIDCSAISELAIHCTSMGATGVVTGSWSNSADMTGATTATLYSDTGASSTTFNAAVLRKTNRMARYFRLRMTTATTTGTTTISVCGFDTVSSPVVATQPVNGTVTANIGTGSLAAGTNAIGDTGIQYRANATGAGTAVALNSPATPAVQSLKGTAGRLIGYHLANSNAATRYLKVFNVAAPTLGTTPAVLDIPIPPNNNPTRFTLEGGIGFSTAITVAITSARGLTNNSTITLDDVTGFAVYA